jgi:hypothetical protein
MPDNTSHTNHVLLVGVCKAHDVAMPAPFQHVDRIPELSLTDRYCFARGLVCRSLFPLGCVGTPS